MNAQADLVVSDMLLAIHGASPNWVRVETTPRHSQALIYVKTGRAQYSFVDGHGFSVEPGDLFFLGKHSRYQGRQLGEECYTFVYADFETPDPQAIAALGLPEVCHARDPEAALELFSRMAACWQAKEPGYRMVCRSYLMRLVAMMVRDQSAAALSGVRGGGRLEAAMRLMRARLNDSTLRIEELAAEAYLSPVQFRRVFHALYGCSPSDYLMQLRLERACDLLRAEVYSVSEAAEQSGFSSVYYFSRVFKKRMGVTPSRYRRHAGDV